MNHETKEFEFTAIKGGKVSLTSRPYNFELQEILETRFPGVLGKITKGESVEIDFTLANVKEDFPKLLDGKLNLVNLAKQNYDLLCSVYHFFLTFKRNAWLRRIKSEKETIASAINQAQAIMALMQSGSSAKVN